MVVQAIPTKAEHKPPQPVPTTNLWHLPLYHGHHRYGGMGTGSIAQAIILEAYGYDTELTEACALHLMLFKAG